ncbi:MAG: hypothetical protein QG620_281 [Patescibacteria group bacterium]|nr:hypothetical protein [Patescibacteria group bacterium]
MYFPEDDLNPAELYEGAWGILGDLCESIRQDDHVCPECGEKMEEFVRLGQVVKYYCPRGMMHSPREDGKAAVELIT